MKWKTYGRRGQGKEVILAKSGLFQARSPFFGGGISGGLFHCTVQAIPD